MHPARSAVIHPFLLTFSEKSLEKRYQEWQNKNYCFIDRWFCYLNLALLIIFIKIEQLSRCESIGILVLVCTTFLYILQLTIMGINNCQHWQNHRIFYVSLFRSSRIILSMIGLPYWIQTPTYQPTPFKSLLVFSGSLYTAWHGFGSPMIFRYHLVLQIPLSCAMLIFTGWSQCNELITFPEILETIQHIKQWMNLPIMWISHPWSLLEPFSVIHNKDHAYMDCLRILFMIYLIFHILVPAYVLWAWEVKMRLNYVETNVLRGGSVQFDPSWIPERPKVLVLITMTVFVIWRFSEFFGQ